MAYIGAPWVQELRNRLDVNDVVPDRESSYVNNAVCTLFEGIRGDSLGVEVMALRITLMEYFMALRGSSEKTRERLIFVPGMVDFRSNGVYDTVFVNASDRHRETDLFVNFNANFRRAFASNMKPREGEKGHGVYYPDVEVCRVKPGLGKKYVGLFEDLDTWTISIIDTVIVDVHGQPVYYYL